MTNEQINIAIAETCGWTDIKHGLGFRPVAKEFSDESKSFVPDYCNDLNAMHEAEKVLTPEQKLEYFNYFIRANAGFYDPEIIFSTARQRAEAFLRTIKDGGGREK